MKTIRYQAIPCAWSTTSSLFAYTHSSLKPSLCFGFQGYIRYGFRLFVFVYALHSVVKPTHAPVFITTLRFIQTIASLKGFDRTIRSITLLVSTPRVLHARQDNTHCHYFAHAKIILPNIWYCIGRLTEHRFTYWLRTNVLRST